MMTSQTLKSVDFTKTQKSRYLENETFSCQIKKFINHKSYFMARNSFVTEVTFKNFKSIESSSQFQFIVFKPKSSLLAY